MSTIVADALPNIPWEDRPSGCNEPLWRYSKNPILGWNPIPGVARIFNSAVIPHGEGFAGVFRADHRNGRPQLHAGRSDDGLSWTIDPKEIRWLDAEGNHAQPQKQKGDLFQGSFLVGHHVS